MICCAQVSSTSVCVVVVALAFCAKDISFPAPLLFMPLLSTSESHWRFSPVFCTVGAGQYEVMATCHHHWQCWLGIA